MPKKPRSRRNTPRQPAPRQPALRQRVTPQQPRWRQKKVLLGGIILALVVGVGVFVRFRQQSQLLPRLQGAVDNHYTHGTAGAPVVIKEFSDYG
ncbi:MAG TPA: hypothetical protein VIH59_10190 [Candidatus Tectomicrobia bacterium]|jgi:hypothetical protein